MATTTSFLVDFDGPKSSELIVSAGAVGGTDGMGVGWGHTATTCADVTAASGITGFSFRLTTNSQDTVIGMATNNISGANAYRYYPFAIAMRENLNADIMTYDRFPDHMYNFDTVRSRHVTSPAEDDLWSIEVNAQDKVEFKKNGVTHYTTTTDVKYPWRVVVDLRDLQTGAATAVHDVSYIGGVPAVTIPSTACGTDWPTPTPATPSSASATGDPHLQNIYGERFDLMKAGNVTLIHIPRDVPVKDSLLIVEADARRLGESCADLYFQTLSITGKWASSDLHFNALEPPERKATWLQLGPVELKVVHGRTEQGHLYLNFFVKHLGRAGSAVGGLLGADDHTEAATASADCHHSVALAKQATRSSDASVASVAVASL